MTAENLEVLALDSEKVFKEYPNLNFEQFESVDYHLTKAVIIIPDNGFFITNKECVYRISETVIDINDRKSITEYCSISLFNKNTRYEVELPVFQSHIEKLFTKKMNLKEFMAGRYNYNPRIMENTKNLLTHYLKSLPQ